jgi:hypothetical protein
MTAEAIVNRRVEYILQRQVAPSVHPSAVRVAGLGPTSVISALSWTRA